MAQAMQGAAYLNGKYVPASEANVSIFEPGDEEAINTKSAAALELVASAAMRLSGLSERAEETAGKSS